MRNFSTHKLLPVILGLGCWLLGTIQPSQAQEFIDRTTEAGLNLILLAGFGTNSVSAADYNNDGRLDLYFVLPQAYSPTNKGTWNLLYRGVQNDKFQEVNSNVGVYGKGGNFDASYMGKKLGASWADFDNDGFADLFLSNAGPDQLLKNNGDGTFSDITNTAGVAGGATQFSAAGLWFDYDSDGDLDLYVSIWEDYAENNRVIRNRMYENTGMGNFEDVSEYSGLDDAGKTWMTVALDVNKDGLLDLYLANDFGPNKLYINHPDKTFSEETAKYGLEDNYEGMGLAIGDANNDGLFDIYLTNATQQSQNSGQINPLFIQQPDTTFVSKSTQAGVERAGWGWGTEFFDYDNNGLQDLYVVNGYFESYQQPNYFFRNISTSDTLLFEDVSADFGVNDQKESRSFLPIDYNNDGFTDLLISNFSEKPVLYQNTTKTGNWLKVSLEGTETNRNGFGSIVEVEAGGTIYKKYHHGAHFYGQSILPVHFGLDEATQIDRLTVHWLNGHKDKITNLPINQSIKIKEMEGLVTTSIKPEVLPGSPQELELIGNYPNPFNGTTRVQFELSVPGNVTFEVFNILGQDVYTSENTFSSPGTKSFTWNTSESNGRVLNSGVYFFRITQNEISKSGTMNFIK